MRFALDQSPDQGSDNVVEPTGLSRSNVEMDDEHPQQREAAEDVEGLDSVPGTCRRQGGLCLDHCGDGARQAGLDSHRGWKFYPVWLAPRESGSCRASL